MSAEPDVALLRRKILGAVLSRAIHAVTQAGVVDRLAAGPAPVAELAEACGVDAHALQRFLRALAGEGLFVRIGPDAWALTPMGALLRSDTPGSLRHLCTLFTGPAYEVWELAPYALRTGKPAFAQRFGPPMFDWLAEHPDRGEEFTAAQAGLVTNRLLPLLDHDWTGVGTVVDVGGGNGTLLAALLQDRPSMTGTVFDLPEVVEQAGPLLDAAGVSDRCTLTGGDFFASVPSGADAYVLAQIILRLIRHLGEVRGATEQRQSAEKPIEDQVEERPMWPPKGATSSQLELSHRCDSRVTRPFANIALGVGTLTARTAKSKRCSVVTCRRASGGGPAPC